MSLLEAFWEQESTPHIRRLFIDEANGRSSGAAEFNFNMFDVVLNFNSNTVTIADVFADGLSEETSMESFLARAESFQDDPRLGDGLTTLERKAPRFVVADDGVVASNPVPESEVPPKQVVAARKAWFSSYTSVKNVFAPADGGPYTCPCCGHLTLSERGGYEICSECGWEDDGQDDHDSALVRGGPNGRESLDEARHAYRHDGGQPQQHKPPTEPV